MISYIPSCFNIQKDICKDDTQREWRKDLDISRYIADWMGNELKKKKKGKISSPLGEESFLLGKEERNFFAFKILYRLVKNSNAPFFPFQFPAGFPVLDDADL